MIGASDEPARSPARWLASPSRRAPETRRRRQHGAASSRELRRERNLETRRPERPPVTPPRRARFPLEMAPRSATSSSYPPLKAPDPRRSATFSPRSASAPRKRGAARLSTRDGSFVASVAPLIPPRDASNLRSAASRSSYRRRPSPSAPATSDSCASVHRSGALLPALTGTDGREAQAARASTRAARTRVRMPSPMPGEQLGARARRGEIPYFRGTTGRATPHLTGAGPGCLDRRRGPRRLRLSPARRSPRSALR